MKHLRLFYEDAIFAKMLKLKTKLGMTWKQVMARGLQGGKDGKNKNK